jgi:hypothetical protein
VIFYACRSTSLCDIPGGRFHDLSSYFFTVRRGNVFADRYVVAFSLPVVFYNTVTYQAFTFGNPVMYNIAGVDGIIFVYPDENIVCHFVSNLLFFSYCFPAAGFHKHALNLALLG